MAENFVEYLDDVGADDRDTAELLDDAALPTKPKLFVIYVVFHKYENVGAQLNCVYYTCFTVAAPVRHIVCV